MYGTLPHAQRAHYNVHHIQMKLRQTETMDGKSVAKPPNKKYKIHNLFWFFFVGLQPFRCACRVREREKKCAELCVLCIPDAHFFCALSLRFSRFSRSRYFKPTWLSLSTSSRNMICHMLSVPAFVYLLANAGHRNVDWQTSHEACRIAYIFFLLVNLKWNMRERENVEERQCWHQCVSATDCDCHCIKMNL